MKQVCLYIVVVVLLLAGNGSCYAQTNATAPAKTSKSDTVATAARSPRWQPIPKKAGLYAALLPGLGQAYNRQYWKMPIVYGGLGIAGYFVVKNSKEYVKLRKAYVGRISASVSHTAPTDDYVSIYSDDQIKQLQSDQNRILNMTILYSSLAYAMQVLDAVTSAHLRNFDISRDISLHVKPTATPYGAGIGLAMNF